MRADCYRVKVPEGARLTGFTASGQRTSVVPGEHVVHRLHPKVPLEGVVETLRFLGADEFGRDIHVPISSPSELNWLLRTVQAGQH